LQRFLQVPYQLLPEIDLLVSFEAQNSNSNGSNAPSYNKPNNKGAAAATTSEWTTDVEKALARNVRRAPGVANLVPNSVTFQCAHACRGRKNSDVRNFQNMSPKY